MITLFLVAQLTGLVADLTVVLIPPHGRRLITEARVLKAGDLVRYEGLAPDGAYTIFDFGRGLSYRVVPSEQIALRTMLAPQFVANARRQGLAEQPPNPRVTETRISLGRDVFDGHPCTIQLVIRGSRQSSRTREFTLVWFAEDLKMPVKLSYTERDGSVIIVEYRNATTRPLDPALFRVPEDFLTTSPF